MDDMGLARAFAESDPGLRVFVRSCLRDDSDADDVVQEVWLTVVRKLPSYDSSRSFRAWVFGIARMQVLKWRQSKARRREFAVPDETIAQMSQAVEDGPVGPSACEDAIRRCLERMGGRPREMLRLKYAVGLKSAEIARRLGMTSGAVDMGLTRARRALRAAVTGMLRREGE